VTDESANGQPIALLDPGLIVLLVVPAARDPNVVAPAIVEQRVVEKFTAIVPAESW